MVWLLAVFLEGLLVVLLHVADRQRDVALAVLAVRFPSHGSRRRRRVELEVVADHVFLVVTGRGKDALEVVTDQILIPLLGGEFLSEFAECRLAWRPLAV